MTHLRHGFTVLASQHADGNLVHAQVVPARRARGRTRLVETASPRRARCT
jgi:hypothetical protein